MEGQGSESRSCAAIFGKLRCRSCTATLAFLQWEVIFTKSCPSTSEKLHCNIDKLRCRKVALSCRFPEDFRLPRLGPADFCGIADSRCCTPTSFCQSGLAQSKDRPNKGGIAEEDRTIGGITRNSIANRATVGHQGHHSALQPRGSHALKMCRGGEHRRGEGSETLIERNVFLEGFRRFLKAFFLSKNLLRTEETNLRKQMLSHPLWLTPQQWYLQAFRGLPLSPGGVWKLKNTIWITPFGILWEKGVSQEKASAEIEGNFSEHIAG